MKQILLLGDSLIAGHNWQARMPSYQVTNLGVPGALTAELFQALPQIKQQADSADLIMVMVGTNDLLCGDYGFIDTLKKILVQLSHDFPTAEIVVNSLFPMALPGLPEHTIANLNRQIEAFASQTACTFLDTHRRFSDSKQRLFQDDGVHLTEAAYEIWARALLEHIAFLIEND